MTVVIEKKSVEELYPLEPSLQEQFNGLQSKMVNLGMSLGLTHPDVVEISQKLDEVHNKLLKVGIKK